MSTSQPARDVAATIAAHRLEGWQPADEHVAALHTLARGDVSFAEYLARFRDRHPPTQPHVRRFRLRRAVPYFIPGTTVLRNEFGATSAETLHELEFAATAGRMAMWLRRVSDRGQADDLDVQVIHRYLFGDVYSWAGEYRTTELRRGDQHFAWQSSIAGRMATVHDSARRAMTVCVGADDSRVAYALARIYADHNQIHPFREGNGRTGAALLQLLARRCGKALDLSGISRDEWYAAARDSMPFRRDGRASHRPFLYLLGPALHDDRQ
ncbi:Fic family protein [Mycobacterium manitobense]|uniref:protein adenylyltransferase n=1 Tax=[Mycobacterium] manitobense TaxID=190147 RepID=A0A9X2YRP8_9MYCO|nr:Fic family protein [[Mycobacterium] manitobense]MCV7172315.1 Fic family protein [[Mycobacterium] manitobense]